MRRFFLLVGVLVLGLVVACGGGSDDSTGTSTAAATSGDAGTSTSSGSGGSSSGSGAGAGSDFCSTDQADEIFNSMDFTNTADLKSNFENLGDVLDQWADNAPNEIKDDVKVLAGGMRGLIELMAEYDYDFIAIGTNAADDPRFLALDSEDFQAASDRISEYCGLDINTSSPGGGSSTGGSTSGGFAVDLPDDFPAELVPPDSTVNFAGNAGFGTTVEFTSTATVEEMKAYYEDALGAPTFADSESVTWSSGNTTVNITGTDGDVTVLILMVAAS